MESLKLAPEAEDELYVNLTKPGQAGAKLKNDYDKLNKALILPKPIQEEIRNHIVFLFNETFRIESKTKKRRTQKRR